MINELDLADYRNGGINMTGFSLIDIDNQIVKSFMETWSSLDSKSWHGPGTGNISVGFVDTGVVSTQSRGMALEQEIYR